LKKIQVSANQAPNALHGGFKGFSKVVWKTKVGDNHVEFSYESKDGEEGYPGNLKVKVIYRIVEMEAVDSDPHKFEYGLLIQYEATTDKTTIVNLTSHPYFNLNGHSKGRNFVNFDFSEIFVRLNSQS
jgi:aldose 1-epimerase